MNVPPDPHLLSILYTFQVSLMLVLGAKLGARQYACGVKQAVCILEKEGKGPERTLAEITRVWTHSPM